jgi:hypothetical protein
MSDLLQSVFPEFADLIASDGFRVVEAVVKQEAFGNASVVLESSGVHLRIYSDRGQRFVDVSGNGQAWHKLEYVLEFLEPTCSQDWFGEPPELGKLAEGLKRNQEAVSSLLANDLAASDFKVFEQKRSADLIAGIFGKP